jgi:5-(carboxyamino)imidazole ribonucleotide synthase
MRLGILGGGQLGRMLALAAYPLGIRCRILDPAEDACAGDVAEVVPGRYDDPDVLDRFVTGLDAVTYEFENVDAAAVDHLEARVVVRPGRQALEVAQDRLAEKSFFQAHGIETTGFAPADSFDELGAAVGEVGLPAIVKTRRFGYDGKGQAVVRSRGDLVSAWDEVGGLPLIVERLVPFDRELSIVAVRGVDGDILAYPLAENQHDGGILRRTTAPAAGVTEELDRTARRYATRLLEDLDYVGVVAIELFQVGGRLLANEMAPRVHNSGHWTIEGAETSQFENHVRAVAGLPLGSTAARGHSAMINLVGALPDEREVLARPHAHLHLYGKDPRPGRKVGHVTVRHDDRERVLETMTSLLTLEGTQ